MRETPRGEHHEGNSDAVANSNHPKQRTVCVGCPFSLSEGCSTFVSSFSHLSSAVSESKALLVLFPPSFQKRKKEEAD